MSGFLGGLLVRCLCMSVLVPACVHGTLGIQDGTCTYRKWERPGMIKLLAVAGVHEPEAGRCGKTVSTTNFPLIIALDWIVSILNGNGSTNSFIPGVTIGYDLYDNCDIVDMTTDLLYSGISMAGQHMDCAGQSPDTPIYVGTLAMTSVEASAVIARLTNPFPVVRPLPSSPSLENQDLNNLLQTVVSFKQEALAMVTLLKTLSWNFVAVLHTDDEYGIQTTAEFLTLARSYDICVNFTAKPDISSITKLHTAMSSAYNNTLTVVYLGDMKSAIRFITLEKDQNNTPRLFGSKLNWMFTSAVGIDPFMKDILLEGDKYITIAYPDRSAGELEDFYTYVFDLHTGDQFKDIFETYTRQHGELITRTRVMHLVDAVLSMVSSVKEVCDPGGGLNKCIGLEKELYNAMKRGVDVNNIFTDAHLPKVYQGGQRMIQFTKTGAQELESLSYTLFYSEKPVLKESKIGNYNGTDEYSFTTDTYLLPSSACSRQHCLACREDIDRRYSYLHGDVLLLGLFSLREYGDSPYTCGKFRRGTNDVITVSSFMEFIKSKRRDTGIHFGGIAIDDCYNGFNTSHFLTELFSKRTIIKDKVSGNVINFDKVFVIVGALSSTVSVIIADMATALGLPMISYGASSPELDSRERYPFFMRTVPSDNLQVKGIIDLIVELEITHAGLIYIDDAYGQNGQRVLMDEAVKRNICIEAPLKVSQKMSLNDLEKQVIAKLYEQQVRVVIYFSIDSIARRLLDIMKTKFKDKKPLIFIASEAWGTNPYLIEGDIGQKSKGSTVFNIATRSYNSEDYRNFLKNLTISQTENNRWIPKYFEDYNRCDFLGSFEKSYPNVCGQNIKRKLEASTVESLYTDQRAVHIMYSVHAATEGYKRLCKDANPSCSPLQVRSKTNDIVRYIKGVNLEGVKLFDTDGNGNIGYTIFNIQLEELTGSFKIDYRQVGSYTKDGKLQLKMNELKFYDDLHKEVSLADMYEVHCSNFHLRCSDVCVLPTTTAESTEAVTTVTMATEKQEDGTLIITTISFGVLLAILAVALILVIVLLLRKQNNQSEKSDGGHSNSMMSHLSSSSGNIYDEPNSVRRHRSTFDNLAFNSHGLSGAGSVPSLKAQQPIQYAHLRQMSNPDVRSHHIRQMSNQELQSQFPDYMPRPMSSLSAPCTHSKISPAVKRLLKSKAQCRPSPNVSVSSLKTPYSAPTVSNRKSEFRSRAASSPRAFRFPVSNDESSYTLPRSDDSLDSLRDRKYGVSEAHVSHSNFDYKAHLRPESPDSDNYLTTRAEQSGNIPGESTLTYLTSKDLVHDSSDEEEDAEEMPDAWFESGHFTPAHPTYMDMNSLNRKQAHSAAKQLHYVPTIISPSDTEVMTINFPQSQANFSKNQNGGQQQIEHTQIEHDYTKSKDSNNQHEVATDRHALKEYHVDSLKKKQNNANIACSEPKRDVNLNANNKGNALSKFGDAYFPNRDYNKADDVSSKKETNAERSSLSEIPDVIKHGPYEEVFMI